MIEAVENIALIAFLMALGVGVTVAVLVGFVRFIERISEYPE
jgi:hypothetical protein